MARANDPKRARGASSSGARSGARRTTTRRSPRPPAPKVEPAVTAAAPEAVQQVAPSTAVEGEAASVPARPAVEPEPVAVAEPSPAVAALEEPATTAPLPLPAAPGLVEGALRLQGQVIAFTWQQTECGLAAGRALLASRSLPELIVVQTELLGRACENAFARGRELARLSAEMLHRPR